MPCWVGMDMGHRVTSVCILDDAGSILTETECASETAAIAAVLKPFRRKRIKAISVEAGVGVQIVRDLRDQAYPIQVVETGRARRFLEVNRLKTDTTDARGLAELSRIGNTIGAEVHVKSIEAQNIRTTLVIRQQIVRQRIKIEQLVAAIIRLNGGSVKRRVSRGTLIKSVDEAKECFRKNKVPIDLGISPLIEVITCLRAHLDQIDSQIKEMAQTHPICRLLMSVPGVGPITALSFYSAIDQPNRFKCISGVGTYFGLTPTLHQSGNLLRIGRISRSGSKMTRTHLVTAATSMMGRTKKEFPLRAWALKLRERVGPGKARVALARKIAVLLLSIWRANKPFDFSRSGVALPV